MLKKTKPISNDNFFLLSKSHALEVPFSFVENEEESIAPGLKETIDENLAPLRSFQKTTGTKISVFSLS